MISGRISEVKPLSLLSFSFGVIKFVVFALIILTFLIHHTIAGLLIWSQNLRLRYYLWSISKTAGAALKVLNVKVSREGNLHEIRQKLIVSNHMSYLDVIILFAYYPALFITSVEIKNTFLLGRICKLAGCFFVERRRSHRSIETKNIELAEMKEKFSQGFNVFLFPEGTSSDGSGVLPFKGTFFQLAVDTETKVQPMCLKYTGSNAHIPPWYGDMTFPDHLFKLCLQREINAHLVILDEVEGSEKMALAKKTQEMISDVYAKN